ncbi:hypothetical protein BBJ28_00019527 [Nothophytophthora sp. Chile5]|nr:hypothetical protein BBJ28_00019527 [Nothophytophthora sp. Chile5]
MLKEVLALLTLVSPRLCRLVGQIWDLASLNVFVLLQLASAALQDAQQLRHQLAFIERFHDEDLEQQTRVIQRQEQALASQRLREQELRAELQTTRQRANRLEVENGQLRLVVSRVLDAQAAMDATRFEDPNTAEQSRQQRDGAIFCADVAAVGDAEERELFGIDVGDEEALARMETVHPVESYATDFEVFFQGLFESETRHVNVLNDMDRFINSTAVALLWRYGSTEEEHQMMHKMLSARTTSTQTDVNALEKTSRPALSSRSEGRWDDDDNDLDDFDDDDRAVKPHEKHQESHRNLAAHENHGKTQQQSIVGLETVLVTKCQVIPATLRAQLHSRPRVQQVLDKKLLNRILLRLYLEKLECDARELRSHRVSSAGPRTDGAAASGSAVPIPVARTPLHRFMKDFFLTRYELQDLADFHMMEVVKSCLFYNEQLNVTRRRTVVPASTHVAGFSPSSTTATGVAALVGCLPGSAHNCNDSPRDHQAQQQQKFAAADVRVALFSRLCELVPFEAHIQTAASPQPAVVGGNLSACLMNAVVDVLGDVLELDPTVLSHAEVEELPSESSWVCPRTLATDLLSKHLAFIGRPALEEAKTRVALLPPVQRALAPPTRTTDCISVDVFLALFATTWVEYDQRLGNKFREGFRHRVLMSSPFATKQMAMIKANADAADTPSAIGSIEAGVSPDFEGGAGRPLSRRANARRSTTVLLPIVVATTTPTPSSPLEALAQIWEALEDETLSPLDKKELESSFRCLLEAKQLDAKHHHRSTISKELPGSPGGGLTFGDVTEKEFVFHVLQVLRRRHNVYGLRTNGRRPYELTSYLEITTTNAQVATVDPDACVPLEMLKPGLFTNVSHMHTG